jgi:hypothetical protein
MIHNNLVLHYPFDGNAQDASGREQHGEIFQATPTLNRLEAPNKAFQFLNSESYIYAKLKKYDYKNCTISCWARWQQQHARAGIFYTGHSGRNGFGLILSGSTCNAGNHLSLLLGGVRCDAFYGHIEMPSFAWIHLCLVKKGTKWTLFLNGEKIIEVTHHYNTPDELFSVGGTITNVNDSFGGAIEDFRWYNRALRPIEIQKIALK